MFTFTIAGLALFVFMGAKALATSNDRTYVDGKPRQHQVTFAPTLKVEPEWMSIGRVVSLAPVTTSPPVQTNLDTDTTVTPSDFAQSAAHTGRPAEPEHDAVSSKNTPVRPPSPEERSGQPRAAGNTLVSTTKNVAGVNLP
jgi:hypothetical protein